MSDPLAAAAPIAALSPPADARAARLAKFKREQRSSNISTAACRSSRSRRRWD